MIIPIFGLVLALSLGGFWWWWHSKAFDRFFAKVTAHLLDLGLVGHRLPDAAANHLISVAIAWFRAKRGFEPKHLAMRFFTWYAVERKSHMSNAFTGEAVLMPAMLTMREWGEKNPALTTAAEQEISKIARYLNDLIETTTMPLDAKLAQQTQILHWAAGEPQVDWKAEFEKAVRAPEPPRGPEPAPSEPLDRGL